MSKINDLSRCLVDKFSVTQADADAFVKEFINLVKASLETDRIVRVKGLGTFKLVETGPRETIDVNTRERITIESRQRLTFTPEPAVKNRINSPFSQFSSVEIDDEADFGEIDRRYAVEKEAEETPKEETGAETPEQRAETETPEPAAEAPAGRVPATAEGKAPAPETAPEVSPGVETEKENEEDGDTETGGGKERTSGIRRGYAIMSAIAVILVAAAGYVCYNMGVAKGLETAVPAEAEAPVTAPVAAETETEAMDTVGKETAAREDSLKEAARLRAEYDKDPRVRLGAYEITGLDKEVRVLPGQTFRGISKAHLGEGMECYVEVFNGGKKDVSPGDTIRIPKLRFRKKSKK